MVLACTFVNRHCVALKATFVDDGFLQMAEHAAAAFRFPPKQTEMLSNKASLKEQEEEVYSATAARKEYHGV
jgi:hypothetical protein